MAATKTPHSLTFIIKIADKINQKGEMVYKRKTFSNIRTDASTENIFNVADSISNLLAKDVVEINLSSTSKITK